MMTASELQGFYAGNEPVLTDLVHTYTGPLRAYAHRWVDDPDDVADVVQET